MSSIEREKIKNELLALCPLDGRYSQVRDKLSPYFSEHALIKNRVKVEVYWLTFLLEKIREESDILCNFDKKKISKILSIYKNFDIKSSMRVKEIESITKHDVKSVELYVAEQLKKLEMDSLVSYVHIGCTSEDITNVAYATMISEALKEVWIPAARKLKNCILRVAEKHDETPMLAHTHGQPATPTTVGKEMAVYVDRLHEALNVVESIQPLAKFNGATGNYAAISVAFPNEGWPVLSMKFIEDYMGLSFNPLTTQIESHDYICRIADAIRHFNNIVTDFDLDMWLYISKEYFKQVPVKAEVGSSTMPHKVNPINFENSEANIVISNALLTALSNKLPCSRMQRDLSDSSVQRNIGLAFGYSLQAIEQTIVGLGKTAVNEEKIAEDLDNKWEVLAEPIQTVLRKYGIPNAYDQLKELTRGKQVTKSDIRKFIKSLDVLSAADKKKLLALTPSTYFGYAPKLVRCRVGESNE